MTLDELPAGSRAEVTALDGEPRVVQRLMDFGLLEGDAVEVVAVAPLGDPIEVAVGPSRVSLRKRDAARITVRPLD